MNVAPELFELTDADFVAIRTRVHERTGIVLADSKRNLVYGRLSRRLRALGCASFKHYLRLLDSDAGEQEQGLLINALTTNLTGFFREPHHFATLAETVIPELTQPARRERRLRFWSAGCSSGEEPYSIAMTLLQALPRRDAWDALILATDIDTDMVATARAGRYDAARADPIPDAPRRRFVQHTADEQVAMAPELQHVIRFRQLNLLDRWPMQGKFDVIFCRNVVIYFDKSTQARLFDRFADILQPDGWLFIGHSESLFRVTDRFRHLGRTTYRKLR